MPATSFETVVGADDGATFIVIPLDMPARFGRVRAPVRVTVNGHTWRTTVMRSGERYCVPVNRANREAAGVTAGQAVTVRLEPDAEPRTVEPPPELVAALAAVEGARAAFDALSYSHRREWADWVAEAKRADTRERRAARVAARVAPVA
jgi:hypothetical protein